jgi:hypothetical protein
MEHKEALQEIARGMNLEGQLLYYKDEAKKLLKEKGLPTAFGELKRKLNELKQAGGPQKDQQANDLFDLLFRLKMVKRFIANDDIENACLNSMLLMRAAVRVQIPLIEPIIERDARRQEGTSKGGKAKVDKKGYGIVIEAFLKEKGLDSRFSAFWTRFTSRHGQDIDAFCLGDYQVWVEDDLLFQQCEANDKERSIKAETAKGYFYEVRKKIKRIGE